MYSHNSKIGSIGNYEYNSKDLIGHGAFAVVYKGRVKKLGTYNILICSPLHELSPRRP
uniref:Protein kinase domain-containing protein n=1 Tax=Lepeophtheirus salmonis TaxID=72036 RepID=A0A0K2TJ60_LEPSM